MFGKHFSSMYEGSLYGAGAMVFAVWGYVIANFRPDKNLGGYVNLNPKMLAATLGEGVDDVQKAIDYLCAPDPNSRNKDRDGRRLVKIAEYDYQVVNGAAYRAIRNEWERREYNRLAQQRHRDKKRAAHRPLPGEALVTRFDMGGPIVGITDGYK